MMLMNLLNVDMIDLDPKEDLAPDSLMPIGEVKMIQIGLKPFQTTRKRYGLDPNEELGIIQILRRNLDLFAWKPFDIPGIDPEIICHQLAIDPAYKMIA